MKPFAPGHEGYASVEWTPELDARLTDLRVNRRMGWKRIGRLIGHDATTCLRRARKIGIAAPLRRLGIYTPSLVAEIVKRRRAGETYRLIAASLGLCHTDVWRHYQDFVSSAARAATEVRQGPGAWAPGMTQGAVLSDTFLPNVKLASPQSSSGGAVSFEGDD